LSFPAFISLQKSVHTQALAGLSKSRSYQPPFNGDEAGSLEGFHLLDMTRQGDNSISILKLRFYKNSLWKYPGFPEDRNNSLKP